jgi:GntR family transcriptional regulator, transcriptional repressor for pyruvate dehydrogenase complex
VNGEAQSRAGEIAETLRGQILGGKYGPGERLPSERELSARTGANRSSVREALKQLEQLGMISIRPGGGARVVPLERAGLGVLRHVLGTGSPNRELVAQWLDVHEMVMSGAARLAVERGTEEEFAEAKRLLRKLAAPTTTDVEFVATGDQLTELIALASRNVVLQMVRNGLTAVAQRQTDTRRKLHATREALQPIIADIERAMDTRDAAAAEDGVRRMFRVNRNVVLDLIVGS